MRRDCPKHEQKKIGDYIDHYLISEEESSEYEKWGALIRFYFHEDPELLSDEEYARAYCQLVYALKRTGQMK